MQAGISQDVLDLIDQKLNETFAKVSDKRIVEKANKSLKYNSGYPNRLECGFSFRGHNICALFNGQPHVAIPGGKYLKDLPAVKAFEDRCEKLNVKLRDWAFIGGVHYSPHGVLPYAWPHIFMDLEIKNKDLVLKP